VASSRRERELARKRVERQAQRRRELARRRRRRTIAVSSVLVTVLALVGVGLAFALSGSSRSPSAAKPPATPATVTPSASPTAAKGTPVCDFVATPNSAGQGKTAPLPPDRKTTGTHVLKLDTNRGPIALTLDGDRAPCTTTALLALVEQKYYDGTSCHRLTTQGIFVVQCGDPTGTGTGSPGFSQPEEGLSGATYKRGTVAMAKGAPSHSTGAQFFLVYKDSPLPPQYTPVGTVTEGLPILDAVAAGGVKGGGSDGPPAQPLELRTVRAA